MSANLFDSLSRGLAALLDPILQVVDEPARLQRLLVTLGVPPNAEHDALIDALSAVAELRRRIEVLAVQQTPSFESIAAVLDAAAQAVESLQRLEQQGPLAALEGLGRELVDLLVMGFLENRVPAARPAAALLTLLEPGDERPPSEPVVRDGRLVRDSYRLDRWQLGRLPALLKDPMAVLRAEYGNPMQTEADAHAMAGKLFPRLARLLRALGLSCRYGVEPFEVAALGDAAALMSHALIVYVDDPLYGAKAESGLVLSLSAAQQGDLGLVISPFGSIALQDTAGPWTLAAEFGAGIDVVAWGRHGVTLLASPGTVEAKGSASATLAPIDAQPPYVMGQPDGARIEVVGARLALEFALSEDRALLAMSADVQKATVVIASGGGDGFLDAILPSGGLRAQGDLGLAWSSDKGLTLRGSATLEASVPVGLSVGGVTLSALNLAIKPQEAEVVAEVSASVAASIGPLKAVLDRIGIAGRLGFPPTGGNLGVANLALGFKPPGGVGLSVEAGGVLTGGGFLFHDEAQKLYAGAMQLSLHETITLKAFGLIATQMPDGRPGFSMIVFITAEDFRPVPLGMGFTLQGIGGMVAVNRSFDQDVLRAGLANGTLANLLFPRDPVSNAPAVIRSLASAFPALRGSYLLGLLARIGWATPTLVQLDLALILQFGARSRLLVLGRISSMLPSRDNDLVRLNLDAMGVLDFDEGTAAIDAVLVDSRLAHKFALTGAMALRARWGAGPGAGFVLAVGGLNPRFAPPAPLPRLDRIAIALCSGDNPRITCEAYFAITSNTLQFGARAQLYAAAYGFSLHGDIGFDVLIQWVPLHFLADFHASVQLKRGSRNLFKVSLKGELEGPRPLRVSGRASFEILWCDFSVRFDKTLIGGEKPPLPPAVDVLAELHKALGTPQSWTTLAPPHASHGVALRKLTTGGAGGPIVLDPLGRVVVKQQVVPLNTARDVDIFGGAPVTGARRFELQATLNGRPQGATALRDQFAPAQFFTMSDDEKLAGPSFEVMDAGLLFGSDELSFDAAEIVGAPLRYEPIVIDDMSRPPPKDPPARPPFFISFAQLHALSATGAAARAPVRGVSLARFRRRAEADDEPHVAAVAAAPPPGVRMQSPRWAIVPLADGAPIPADGTLHTWSEYRARLGALNRGGARWQVVPLHEVQG
ncbi:hypothetical protein GCM10023165_02840 [Variovorax defluvii]|uniref:DUF6603 domain-containing protein n=1 Tax=Variovorax defluvii TaxID=913761 RepID=A0ABP8GU93_9BURK